MIRWRRVVLPITLVWLGGCEQLTRIDEGTQACVPPAVQAAFDRGCALGGCHDASGAAAGLVLTADASAEVLTRTASQQTLPLVAIGEVERSYLAHKLMDDPPQPIMGARMPVGFDASNAMQAGDVATILGWIAGASFSGCEAATDGDSGLAEGEGTTDSGMAETGTAEGASTETGAAMNGLPCEIDELLARSCRSCHGDPLQGGPMPLVTRDDLLAATPSDPMRTVAERAAERMADTAAPMPPAPGSPVTADELAMFEAWLVAGTPEGSCGSDDSTGEPPEPDPFDVEPMCSSGRTWSEGDDGDPRMHPGRDCIGCHDDERPDDDDVPDLVIAGTIYPTAHEPDDCIGVSTPELQVVVQSMASGDEVTLSPNSSGNFLLHRSDAPAGFEAPFGVKLVEGDRERIMPIAAPSGRCNSCHTQDGAMGAPGRVVQP